MAGRMKSIVVFTNYNIIKEWANFHQSNIDKWKQYLYPGKYRLYCKSRRYTWKRERSCLRWIYKTLFHSNISFNQRMNIVFFSHSYIIAESSQLSCGDGLYVTRKGQLKIFDYNRMKVHYFPFSASSIEKAEHFRKKYAPYFSEQIIDNIDSEKQCITERYVIENKEWRNNTVDVIRNMQLVWASLCEYTKSAMNEVVTISVPEYLSNVSTLCKNTKLSVLLQEIGTKAVKHIKAIPTIPQHNDMVLSNILMGQNGVTVFDYEFFDYNLFYYDALMFIVWEAVSYNHDIYLHNYMNGDYDYFFSNLFAAANFPYNRMLKRAYVELFLVANIHMHLKTGDGTNISRYRRVFDILETYQNTTV